MNPEGLLDYQVPAAETLLAAIEKHGGALDCSDMGTGKTFTAGAVLRHLDLPSLVVCPAVSITSWKRAGEHLKTEFDVLNYEMLRTGNTPFGTWENPRPKPAPKDFFCLCCQLQVDPENPERCPVRYDGIHCVETKPRPHKYGKFTWHPGLRVLVFDEVHRAGALDSLHSEMLLAARRQNVKVLGLSATVATTPLNFKALGYVLGLHSYVDTSNSPGFYRWAAGLGCGRDGLRGFVFRGSEADRRRHMAQLHHQLFPSRGTRVRIEDLGAAFPECQITADLYDLERTGQIDALYREMAEALLELRDRVGDSISSHPLTRILRARQEIELLKIPIYEELARQGLENGHSVAIFVNFTQTLDELCKRFKTSCRVDGSQTGPAGHRRRQACVDAFQANKERIIILNGQAGGVSISLHDLHGGHPRLGIVSLSYSAVVVRQILGRLRRAGGKSKALYRIPLVAGTVEERVHKLVTPKLNNLDSLNDADLWSENLPLTKSELSTLLDHASETHENEGR